MPYRPLVSPGDLPPEGPFSNKARERQDLDFKSEAHRAAPWEHAKDIAAFANSLGGTLLIGASNKDTLVFHGLRNQTDAEVMDIYEGAALQCSPVVPIDPVPIHLPSGATLVAVNVPPYPDALVGVPAAIKDNSSSGHDRSPKPTYRRAANGWRFPIRRASQTHFLSPEHLPLYMNPAVRRAYVRLEAIPPEREGFNTRKVCVFSRRLPAMDVSPLDELVVQLTDVSLETNTVTLRYFEQRGSNMVRVPLIDVEDVWQHDERRWALRVRGSLVLTDEVEEPFNRPYFKLAYTLLP